MLDLMEKISPEIREKINNDKEIREELARIERDILNLFEKILAKSSNK